MDARRTRGSFPPHRVSSRAPPAFPASPTAFGCRRTDAPRTCLLATRTHVPFYDRRNQEKFSTWCLLLLLLVESSDLSDMLRRHTCRDAPWIFFREMTVWQKCRGTEHDAANQTRERPGSRVHRACALPQAPPQGTTRRLKEKARITRQLKHDDAKSHSRIPAAVEAMPGPATCADIRQTAGLLLAASPRKRAAELLNAWRLGASRCNGARAFEKEGGKKATALSLKIRGRGHGTTSWSRERA